MKMRGRERKKNIINYFTTYKMYYFPEYFPKFSIVQPRIDMNNFSPLQHTLNKAFVHDGSQWFVADITQPYWCTFVISRDVLYCLLKIKSLSGKIHRYKVGTLLRKGLEIF